MTSRILPLVLLGTLGVSLPGCAHRGAPIERKTVSTVSNQDMTGNPAEPDKKRMSYLRVSDEDALNQDPARIEHESQNGHLSGGDAPVLRPSNKNQQASAPQQ